MVNNPAPADKNGLKCPQCAKSRFKSFVAVRDHFLTLNHPIYCTKCNKEFQDVMPLIDHYQSHDKKKTAPSKSLAKEATKQNSNLPSVNPKNSHPKNSQQKTKQKTTPKTTPKTTDQAASRAPKVTDLALSLYATVPAPIISAQVPKNAAIDTNLYMTRKIMFEDLRSKCHHACRLEREGYFLEFIPLPDSDRVRPGVTIFEEFQLAPRVKFPSTKRLAIVVDCEMVEVDGTIPPFWYQEVVSLSAVDFFTGEVLINNLVKPTQQVKDWRTKVSGVSPALMNSACAAGEVIVGGWEAARQQLWEFMDEHTVLIGHSLQHDLKVLGMLHYNIVDSSILISEAVFTPSTDTQRLKRKWGLKTLAKEILNREIQAGESGHSALEDAFATRDVVFWCMCNPQLLISWAKQQRVQEEARIQLLKEKKFLKKGTGKRHSGKSSKYKNLDEEQGHQSSELEHWSDIAEECGYH